MPQPTLRDGHDSRKNIGLQHLCHGYLRALGVKGRCDARDERVPLSCGRRKERGSVRGANELAESHPAHSLLEVLPEVVLQGGLGRVVVVVQSRLLNLCDNLGVRRSGTEGTVVNGVFLQT